MSKRITAFLSSPLEDLRVHRSHVLETLKRLEVDVETMEDFSSQPEEPLRVIRRKIDACDFVILIVPWRRGSIPKDHTKSFTQLEYEYALEKKLPILVYMLREDASWKRAFDELEKDPEIVLWRTQLQQDYTVAWFGEDVTTLNVEPSVLEMKERLRNATAPLRSAAAAASNVYLEAMRNEEVYVPELYASRVDLETHLRSFLDTKCNRTGMLIVGSSGVGKTTTLCHIVANWREGAGPLGPDIVLLFGAGTLSGDNWSLKKTLLEQLQLSEQGFGSLQSQMIDIQSKTGARLVLVIDGIDKHPQPSELLRQIDQLIVECEAAPWLKVIASIGEVVYNTIVNSDSAPLALRAYYTFASGEGVVRKEQAGVPLGRLTDAELRDAYERYRHRKGFAPLSLFDELTDDVKSAIADPLFLRIVMEVFKGRRIPRRVLTAEVLTEYCQKRVFGHPEREEFVTHFVRYLYERKVTSAKTDDLRHVDVLRGYMKEHDTNSPYVKLLDDKVLQKQEKKPSSLRPAQTWIGFTYDRLLEYLLFISVMTEGEPSPDDTTDHQKIIAKLCVDVADYPPLLGVLVDVLQDSIEVGGFAEAARLLHAGEVGVMRRVAVDLLVELELMDPSSGTPTEDCAQASPSVCLIEAMATVRPPWLKDALLDFGMRCQRLGRLASAKLVYQCGLRFCQDAGDADGVAEMVDALGSTQFGLGELMEARGTLEEAVARFRELSGSSPSDTYTRAEALCLINLSEVHHRQGNIPKAKELLDESRQILERINDRQGLGIAIQKQAVLMRRDGCSGDARERHLEALRIADELGDDRGRAMNLCGIGLTYLVDGDWEPAFRELEKALSEYEKIGDKTGIAYTCNALGETYRWQGDDLDQAMLVYARALRLYQEMGAERDIHMVENNLGATYLFAGDATKAMAHLRRAQELQIKEGHAPGEPETLAFISGAALDMGDMETALSVSDAADSLLMEDQRRFGEEDIQLVFWYRYLILQALGRQHDAQQAIQVAYDNVMAQVDALCEVEAREAFIQSYRLRRQIVEAARSAAQ